MKKIVIVAESGSDITPELAKQYEIEIVPMHVTFESESLDDGSFEVDKIVQYYKETGKLPKTSGSTPDDFMRVFDRIHKDYPQAHILYLAYSAITTVSYQSAVIASESRDYITLIDTKQVSIGQGIIVCKVAEYVKHNPDISIEELVDYTKDLINKAKMCFMPDDLEFLKAGGRVSNVAFLGSRILSLHPVIEIIDGKLVATKKYRGKMTKVVEEMMNDFIRNYHLEKEDMWIVSVIGTSDVVKQAMERVAKNSGFKNIQWIQAGGVITTHGGPAAIGLAGFSKVL